MFISKLFIDTAEPPVDGSEIVVSLQDDGHALVVQGNFMHYYEAWLSQGCPHDFPDVPVKETVQHQPKGKRFPESYVIPLDYLVCDVQGATIEIAVIQRMPYETEHEFRSRVVPYPVRRIYTGKPIQQGYFSVDGVRGPVVQFDLNLEDYQA